MGRFSPSLSNDLLTIFARDVDVISPMILALELDDLKVGSLIHSPRTMEPAFCGIELEGEKRGLMELLHIASILNLK